jgi:hypothetical protein
MMQAHPSKEMDAGLMKSSGSTVQRVENFGSGRIPAAAPRRAVHGR